MLRRWFALGSSRSVFLMDRTSEKIAGVELDLPVEGQPWIQTFASPDGNELWVVESTTRTLTRYAVP